MAVAFDAKGFHDAASGTTNSGTPITVGSGSNTCLCVGLHFQGTAGLPTGITVTWDVGGTNQAMTAVTNASGNDTAQGSTDSVIWYALVAPTSGLKTLTASWTGARISCMGAVSFTGVDQTGGNTSFPHGAANTVNGTTATVTVTSATNNMTIAMHAEDGGTTFTTTSATNAFTDNGTISTAVNYTAGTASNVMTATLAVANAAESCGFDIVAAAASGSPTIPYDLSDGPWRIQQTQIDLSKATNLNLFKNPIPFGPYDYSDGPRNVVRFLPDPSRATNLNLFKNPIPFGPYDYSDGSWRIRQTQINLAQPSNLNLYSGVIQAPFFQTMWIDTFFPQTPPIGSAPLNINLFTNPIPFGPFDLSDSVRFPLVPQSSQPYNQSLYTVTITLMGQAWI